MSGLHVALSVGSFDGTKWRTVQAVADSGSSHTALPPSLLREVGIKATDAGRFRLADGSVREYPMGVARLQLEGRETYTSVVFAEEELEPRLGFITLAEMRFEVSPDGTSLVPVLGFFMSPRRVED